MKTRPLILRVPLPPQVVVTDEYATVNKKRKDKAPHQHDTKERSERKHDETKMVKGRGLGPRHPRSQREHHRRLYLDVI